MGLRMTRSSRKGRVILDNTPLRTAKRPREKQTDNHVLSSDLAAGELEATGFHILDRDDAFIGSWYSTVYE